MSVAHWLLAFFQHPFVFSFTLMQPHTFNIWSLMFLSFSNISNGSQWTEPHSLQINKHTHIATGTYNNFILYQSLLQASYLCLSVFKTVTMPCQTTQENFTFIPAYSSNSGLGAHTLQQVVHEPHTVYIAYNLNTVTHQPKGPTYTFTNCICIPCFYITACLTLIIRRSRTGTVWFYTSTSNKRAARPKLYTKSLTRDLKPMYSRFTLVRISIKL